MSTPSTDWKENVPEGEDARLLRLAEELNELQKRRKKNGKAGRALHLKQNVGVEATLEVLGDLPEHAAQGLFAKAKTYRAYVRFSNGSGGHAPDRTGDIRGLAIKVLGVDGKKIIPGLEDAKTQDILLIHTPTSPFKDPYEFIAVVIAASGSQLLLLPRLASRIGLGRALGLARALIAAMKKPFTSFVGTPMYTLLPLCWGKYAARLALLPREDEKPPAAMGPTDDALGDHLKERLKKGHLVWDLAAQFFIDEKSTPIEDPSVDWSDAPWITIGRLTIPKQDADGERGKKLDAYIESLSFDPWHSLVDHRPLGAMMRARNHAYRLSTMERGAAPEPDGSEKI